MNVWRSLVRRVLVAGLLAGASLAQAQPAAALPSAHAFFDPPQLASAQLSPSGRWLAALKGGPNGRIGFEMLDLEGKEGSKFIETAKDDVGWFRWVDDDWLVFTVYDRQDRRRGGYGSGLIRMRRDGSATRTLIAREWDPGDPFRKRRELEPDNFYLSLGAAGSTEVIIGERQLDNAGEYSHTRLRALDVASGEVRSVHADAPKADAWWFDGKGQARVATHRSGDTTMLYWADKSGAWREIAKLPRFDLPYWPAYVDGDDGLVVVTGDGTGSSQFRRFDFAANKPAAEIMLSTPGFSGAATTLRDRNSARVLGLHLPLDADTVVWFSPTMQKIQADVDAKLPGSVNELSCAPSCENPKLVLIYTYAASDPGSFVLYRPQQGSWQLVGHARPDIDPARMARMSFQRFKARDGHEVPLWVTHPTQAGAAKPKAGPAVVLVHGGPNDRGTKWAWKDEAQFLASRGYTVIEPEFRGSTGYGEEHFRAGWKQWGQKMQDDVTDALRYAVAQGWVDASRVCIMGASYGGYSTLMGLIRDPDLYRCGVSFAAVTDPRFMYEFHWNDISDDGKAYQLPKTMGDPKTDDAMFAANSPVVQAARIKSPLLLVQGAVDRRVPVQNGERMRDALRSAGNKNFEWVLYSDEGHGFKFPNNEFDYWSRVEAFLAKHLK